MIYYNTKILEKEPPFDPKKLVKMAYKLPEKEGNKEGGIGLDLRCSRRLKAQNFGSESLSILFNLLKYSKLKVYKLVD